MRPDKTETSSQARNRQKRKKEKVETRRGQKGREEKKAAAKTCQLFQAICATNQKWRRSVERDDAPSDEERVSTLAIWPIGAFEHVRPYPFIITHGWNFRGRDTSAQCVFTWPDMCHDFIISAQRQSTGKKGVNTWWWPPFVSLIVSAALFLSSLVTSATGFAPMARPRKNATYCAKSIWPGWLLLFFGAFFHEVSRGGRSTPVPPRRRLVTTNVVRSHSLLSFSRCLSPTRVYRNVGNVQVCCIETINFMGASKG